ncbi:MAG: cupin domain-containing protein [Pseudomonadota bacterium]
MHNGPFDLSKTPIHIDSYGATQSTAVPLTEFHFESADFSRYIAEHCSETSPGRLVMIEQTDADWPAWECHQDGEELVIVLSGRGTLLQELPGGVQRLPFQAGDTLINPRGVWHTADVEEPMRAIYLTPCHGTEHRLR